MNLLAYALVAVVSYLGLVAGYILSIVAKEEMKPGRKYFIAAQKILVIVIFLSLIVLGKGYIPILLTIVFILLARKDLSSPIMYIFFAFVLYLSKSLPLFAVESSLILLYGLPTGALIAKKEMKENMMNLSKYLVFIAALILLFFLK